MSEHGLFIVDPNDDRPTPVQIRRKMSKMFGDLARRTAEGRGFIAGGEERAPIRAAMVVVFSSDGEPTPIMVGFDKGTEREFLHDAHEALFHLSRAYIPGRIVRSYLERTGAEEMTSVYQGIREYWYRSEASRDRNRLREAAEREARERANPFLCDCGARTKTAAGLKRHQAGGPHRQWAERQVQS